MGVISFFNFHLLKLKIIAENQCEKHKKTSLIVYNASKKSVISILGNTLIQICVFGRKKKPKQFRSQVIALLIGKMCRSICGIEHFIYGDLKYSLV